MSSFPRIDSRRANTVGYGWFRARVLIFALVLACFAVWILAAEFSRPPALAFPTDPETAADASAHRSDAHLAAQLGMLRGDLWADDALTYSDVLRPDEKNNVAKDSIAIEQARTIAERALAFAPHDARIWLVLASIDSRFDGLNGKASAALRNSYYTGANETALIPIRLLLSLSLPVISDTDFQQLVRHDLRTIVLRKPEMKFAIVNAYQFALPDGKQFTLDALKELDPNLLSKLLQKQ